MSVCSPASLIEPTTVGHQLRLPAVTISRALLEADFRNQGIDRALAHKRVSALIRNPDSIADPQLRQVVTESVRTDPLESPTASLRVWQLSGVFFLLYASGMAGRCHPYSLLAFPPASVSVLVQCLFPLPPSARKAGHRRRLRAHPTRPPARARRSLRDREGHAPRGSHAFVPLSPHAHV